MDLTPESRKVSKLSAITRNLSENKSRLVSNVFKWFHDIRRSTDFNKSYLGTLLNVNSTKKLNSLSDFVTKNDIKIKSDIKKRLSVDETQSPTKVDKCVQTDITEFAKIKVLGENSESADDFMDYSENLIQELEFEKTKNLDNFQYFKQNVCNKLANEMQIYLCSNDYFNDYKTLASDTSVETVPKITDVSHMMRRYPNNEKGRQLLVNSTPKASESRRLILDSNIIVYKSEKCCDFELAEDAYQLQFTGHESRSQTVDRPVNDLHKSVQMVQSVLTQVKWSDLVDLLKMKIDK